MDKEKKIKLSYVIALGFLALWLFSFNKRNETMNNATESKQPEVEASSLSEWNNETRSTNSTQDEKAIRFRDLETYHKVQVN